MPEIPMSMNATVRDILRDAKNRGIIGGIIHDLPVLLDITSDMVAARTRKEPLAPWTVEQLSVLIKYFFATRAPDLAGRVLRVLHPTWPIYFQGEMFPDVESSGNVYADEAVLLEKTGSLFHEIAIDLDDDGEIDDREADRVSKAANEARLGIERVLTALSHRRVHAQP